MLLAVMGDSHDNRQAFRAAVKIAVDKGAKTLFHTGDLVSAFMLEILYDFPGRIYLVKGNNDGDPLAVSRTIPQECPQIKEYGEFIIVDFDEFRVALTHYPEHARAHAIAGDFDMVFYGHTHEFSEKMVGKTLLLNPGDIMGLKEEGGFCLVESDTKKVQRLYV
ncbi:MAG: YfcE family phosphodiesterase [bacterium]|nr:MAG: YfcE family phosphodiesterase [bacterium]